MTPTRREFRQMLQRLLADRFAVKVHREMRETPIYALVVGKSGPKFTQSSDSGECQSYQRRIDDGLGIEESLKNCSMDVLVEMLSGSDALDRPLRNMTGLTGRYDLTLKFARNLAVTPDGDSASREVGISTAVSDIGLKLEPRKAPMSILVIDHIERPTDN